MTQIMRHLHMGCGESLNSPLLSLLRQMQPNTEAHRATDKTAQAMRSTLREKDLERR